MHEEKLPAFRAVMLRLRQGPYPAGEEFELCREVLAAAPGTPEGQQAARLLLEGAMADAHTTSGDAQLIMEMLKALDRGQLRWEQLLVSTSAAMG